MRSSFHRASRSPFDMRLEQPASSMLWLFPELARLLGMCEYQRLHTWMRKFQHPLPKPTVLMGNMLLEYMKPLERAWSKKMEAQWLRMLISKLLTHNGARKLILKRSKCLDLVFKHDRSNRGISELRCASARSSSRSRPRRSTTPRPCRRVVAALLSRVART